jgi:hypothetical protein
MRNLIRRILREEFDEKRKQRVMDKIINILTTSIYVREKGNELIFWFVTDQINEPIFKYNKRKGTLIVLKGKVRNYLDIYLPQTMDNEFRLNVLRKVFVNLTSSLLPLNTITYEQ